MSDGFRVADHAVLRLLERRYGFDVEKVRDEISRLTRPAARAGASVVADGELCFVIRNMVVVTARPAISKHDEARERQRRGE